MKLNSPLKFSLFICLIISFYVFLYISFLSEKNSLLLAIILLILFFFSIFYLLKFQFYEKIKIIYKNIYKFKGTSNVADLNLDNANIEAEEWANQQEEDVRMKENENYRRNLLEMYHMN